MKLIFIKLKFFKSQNFFNLNAAFIECKRHQKQAHPSCVFAKKNNGKEVCWNAKMHTNLDTAS